MLNGKRILVVEKEFLIALDIQRILEGAGAGQIIFARSTKEANAIPDQKDTFGLALIEVVSAFDSSAIDLARDFLASRVPVVISSADASLRHGVDGLAEHGVIIKPFREEDLIAACR